ncbi:MAG: IclR family transcriptional regulator [Rhodobacteraceae bacterium]|nr:IclR family transcriptional regulator [Paracoccaceae bacterium]
MVPDGDAPETDGRRGIQSIEVGYRLIATLAGAPGKMTLKALAEGSGMSPSKAHLYLVSFQRLGLVVQDRATQRYGLGPTAIDLGLAAINQIDVVDAGRREMEPLVDEFGASLGLSVWGNRGPTIIFRLDGSWPSPLSVKVGYVLPVLSTATGRVFLAHLPERSWRDLVRVEARSDKGRLQRALAAVEEIRAGGLARTDSEMNEGFVGLSAPVLGPSGEIRAAITALGLAEDPALSAGSPLGAALTAAARRISRAIGWQG